MARPGQIHRMKLHGRIVALGLLLLAGTVGAQQPKRIGYSQVLDLAARVSPTMAVARAQEAVIASDIRVAGIVANPTLIGGTSTQAARLSVGLALPLNVLGQRGAAIRASEADFAAARVGTQATESDVRSAAAHAFVALWLAERRANARAEAEQLAKWIDDAVATRVQLGGAPQVEGVRSRALRLRAHADAVEAAQLVAATAADLGRWIGATDASELRTQGDPQVPASAPPLAALLERVGQGPAVVREQAAAHAARARADRERALARPALTLEVGLDARDPTLPATNYRAQLGVEVPVFTLRGPYVEREERSAAAAEVRALWEASILHSDLLVAYRTFEATTARRDVLEQAGLPAALAAARSTQESYSLGHASLEALLDADRSLIDTELSLLEAQAARANAWIDVEHATGVR